MKKTLILAAIILCNMVAYSQTNAKSYLYLKGNWDKENQEWIYQDIVPLPTSFMFKPGVLKVTNIVTDKTYKITGILRKEGSDCDMSATDNSGKKCTILMYMTSDDQFAISIVYATISHTYFVTVE